MKDKEKNFISAICYVRNSEKSIESFLEMLVGFLQESFEKYEIICVDDASEDGSIAAIKNFAQKQHNIILTVLRMGYFHGVELSMNAGNDLAIGDFVYEFDSCICDYDVDIMESVYHKALEGNDIVAAVPDKQSKRSSRIFYAVFKSLSEQKMELQTERFRILSRRAINRIHMMNDKIPYRKVVYLNCGLQMGKIIYSRKSVRGKEGKRNDMSGYRINLAVDSLILFTQAGYKLSIRMTLGMILLTVICAVYAAGIFLSGKAITGWTTTMLFLSLSFGILFGILTIIVKYLSILVDLVFRKKNYIFENIEKISKE